jgi:hypothetical protein
VGEWTLATDFLSPERIPTDVLTRIRSEILAYPPLARLLNESPAPLVILNGLRQLVYCNPAFLASLDTLPMIEGQDPAGMRPGEIWHCMQAENSPAGCGTSYACRTCHISNTLLNAMKWGDENDWERIQRLHLGSIDIEMRAKSIYLLGEMVLLCRFGDEPYRSPSPPESPGTPSLGPLADGLLADMRVHGEDIEATPQPDPLSGETLPSDPLSDGTRPSDIPPHDVPPAANLPSESVASGSLPPDTPVAVAELYAFLSCCGEF